MRVTSGLRTTSSLVKRMKAAVDAEAEAGASVAATAAGDSGEWDASVSLESLRSGIGGFARERGESARVCQEGSPRGFFFFER